jgi:hypothetical protein
MSKGFTRKYVRGGTTITRRVASPLVDPSPEFMFAACRQWLAFETGMTQQRTAQCLTSTFTASNVFYS